MPTTDSKLYLDHVILLLPYDMLANPPSWLTDSFTISPGGRHADNKTENRLVMFRDGTYLELIAFINDDPEKRRGHWWDKPYGVVDFAFTTTELDYDGIVRRLKDSASDISYEKPKAGGRITPDGKELKWETTFPTGIDRGNVPFFCTDVTPRERRVPTTEANTTHPSGVLGMAGMSIELAERHVERVSKATAAILDEKINQGGRYDASAPKDIPELKQASVDISSTTAGDSRDLALTLKLQTLNQDRPRQISERIEGGIISISID